MSLANIYEGWMNNLFPQEDKKEIIKMVQDYRMEICKGCPEHSSNKKPSNTLRWDDHCTNCGCTLSAKTACLSCKCPLDKWAAMISEEQKNILL